MELHAGESAAMGRNASCSLLAARWRSSKRCYWSRLYRDWRLWAIQELTLVFAVGAMLATMKLFNMQLNLLNVLAFRLVLAIGVDYGIYVLFAWQKAHDIEHDVAGVVKPVLLAGLTAVSGFGSLVLAKNPSLSGLGVACAIGIFWSLVATIFFTLPAAAAARPKSWGD